MGIISNLYKKMFVCRYDKEVGVPYYSHLDFNDLHQEAFSFINSQGVDIHYFYYYYDNFKKDKLILFLHGIGPGHAAYLAEIETLCKRGYKVLTLDYTGCGESGGKLLGSLNQPTSDVLGLLDKLNLNVPIVLVGHSLGGYTALNVINLRKNLQKAVILSGFLSIKSLASSLIKNSFLVSRILKYEEKVLPELFKVDNLSYLKNTDDKIFFIQSEDDGMVPYSIGLGVVETLNNPNIKTLKMSKRKHNPNYTEDAVFYMNEVFGQYNYLVKKKKIKTDEEKVNYFKDVSLYRLTAQNEDLFDQIDSFIKK